MISYRKMEEAWDLFESLERMGRTGRFRPRYILASPKTYAEIRELYHRPPPTWIDPDSGRAALSWNDGYITRRRWVPDDHLMFLNRGLLILTAHIGVDKSDLSG